MKQPVSIDSFDPRTGRVGVYLQEGGPLTDALWNEASDIHLQMLRWLAIDAGLEGTCGDELLVLAPEEEYCGQRTLVLEGGPGRFYCAGLPIQWPTRRRIEEQRHCCQVLVGFTPQSGEHWTAGLVSGESYSVVLDAWLDEIDESIHPQLDDPALFCNNRRGSYRKVIRSCVRVVHGEPESLKWTNIELTIQGSYQGTSNGLYAVELLWGRRHSSGYRIGLLWDDAGASTASRVSKEAEAFSNEVHLESAKGFAVGHFVRFEGIGAPCCAGDEIYEISDIEGDALKIQRSRCGRRAISLEDCEPLRWAPDPDSLAYELRISSHCLGNEKLPEVGDLVTGVADEPDRVWVVKAIDCGPQPGVDDCCERDLIEYQLVPDGLAEAIEPWAHDRAATIARPAHPFSWCVTVEDRPDWREGMRIKLTARAIDDETVLPCGPPDPPDPCEPGRSRVRAEEVRTITKIVRCCQPRQCCEGEEGQDEAEPLMLLRLDAPLSYEHTACFDAAVPECPVRAVRFSGHECGVEVGRIEECGERENGPCCLKDPLELPNGLELFFTIPMSDPTQDSTKPTVERGDGWRFAVRANGWVQPKVFAPVDPRVHCRTTLATFVWNARKGFEQLDDRRPRPCCCPEDPVEPTEDLDEAAPEDSEGDDADPNGALHGRELSGGSAPSAPAEANESLASSSDSPAPQSGSAPASTFRRVLVPARLPPSREIPAPLSLRDAQGDSTTESTTTENSGERPSASLNANTAPAEEPVEPPTAPARVLRLAPALEAEASGEDDGGDVSSQEEATPHREEANEQPAPQNLLAAPIEAVRYFASLGRKSRKRMLKKWSSLESCYLETDQIKGHHQVAVHEVIIDLVHNTLRIAKAADGVDDEYHQRELEELWSGLLNIELLPRPVHLVDALWMLEHGPRQEEP